MKKRFLASLLCVMLSVSMVAQVGAEMLTEQATAESELVTTSLETDHAESGSKEGMPSTDGNGAEVGTPSADGNGAEVGMPSTDGNGAEVGTPSTDGNGAEAGTPSADENGAEAGTPSTDGNGAEVGTPSTDGNGAEAGMPSTDGNGAEAGTPSTDGNGVEAGTPSTDGNGVEVGTPSTDEIFTDASKDNTDGNAEEKEETIAESENQPAIITTMVEKTAFYASDWELVDTKWRLCKSVTTTESGSEKEYYTLEDGIVHIVTVQSETDATKLADAYYLFDRDGYLVTGRYNMEVGTNGYSYPTSYEYFYMDETNASYISSTLEGTPKTPYNSNLGQLQKQYWLWTGSAFCYYDDIGKFTSVAELKQQKLASGTYDGYYEINGEYYALKEDGTPVTGSYKITEGNKPGYYYFKVAPKNGIIGAMVRNSWVSTQSKTRWRYYGADGLRTNFSPMVTALDSSMGTSQYLLNKSGYLVMNKPCKVNGVYYFGDAKGQIKTNAIVTYKGKRYYFTADGTRATYKNGWYRCGSANRYYYFDSTGGRIKEKTGWKKIKNQWYYFSKNGNHYVNKWTSTGRYFYADGHMATGLCTIDGAKYFFKATGTSSVGSGGKPYKSTIVKSGSTWYYANSSGKLVKSGWVKYSGNYYYLKSYKIQKKTFAKRNGVNGYLDSEGKYQTGWVTFNDSKNRVKYVNPTGNSFYKNTTVTINGLQYRFDSNGYRVNDRSSEISGPYYVEVDIVNCVMTVYNSSKTIPVKSMRISPGASGTPTPTGTYYLSRLGRWWTLMGPSYGQYCTHVVGAGEGGIIIHSVPVVEKSVYSFSKGSYNLLGQPASHGCIRCCVADSKWIYDHCQGATVKIFRGTYNSKEVFKGPLGRPALVKATGNYDPTDPAV